MGRGRAKAKQTKVARELKYWTPDTDLRALERELHGEQTRQPGRGNASKSHDDWDDDEDDYSGWASRSH
ncbi:DUF3073 domain-containing protein [Dermatophilus congolensis]|nr:DUF3073 domain-containing protein [Dermatophilus congolensis]MBO3130042.1 DUF3073 domain-containing protein [Dermatophilus congolensis]MBO3131330.1 DUF3073 domain-containing protein [Dermatophilus congolensis]MBO3134514.1 DUF3073 domain-containing protein [Dermatophilus congolensis]MBO3136751.1 DUF3073 domain-containing protein [Dermatophilus congolensis]MBO3138994.1 DUF3073 domain-containing protein [Dermatophilus congolensis]